MTPGGGRAILGGVKSFSAEEWAKVREEGRAPFLLRYGLLGRGLPLGVITAIAVDVFRGAQFPDLLQTGSFYGLLAFCVAVFTASGCLGANANWIVHERRHGG